MSTPFAGCKGARDFLDAAERADPAGHAMHLAAVAAWAFASGISNAAEGITWGILAAISVARIPKVWRCWIPILTDPLWLALLGWTAWLCLSTALSPVPMEGGRRLVPERWVFTPLLVWPTLSRPWVLLASIGAGALVQVVSALVMSWSGWGWLRNTGATGLSGFGQLQWQLHCAVVLSAAGVRWLPARARWAALAALAASLLVIERGSRRLALVGAMIGAGLVMLRPIAGSRRRAWAAGACLAAVAVAAVAWSGAAERSWKGTQAAVRRAAQGELYVAANQASGLRLSLAHAAWDTGMQRPVLGSGRGSYRSSLLEWTARQRTEHPERSETLGLVERRSLNDAHNALLNAFAEGGLPAAACLGIALLGTALRLWRGSRTAVTASVALALYSAILLGMVCQPVTAKAPGAIIAVCLAISGIDRRPE